ncbi:hypothetical protein OF83DRAFT_658957 [Amylostereum chailletii]|nr:hypothetical protein OF83DRAFT_658957 [Amylostereum chailletii]
MPLPPFLELCTEREPGKLYTDGIFNHKSPFGSSHVLWWPPRDESAPPRTVALFIPGNPGLTEFYASFLSRLHTSASNSFAILAHALLGFHGSINRSTSSTIPKPEAVGLLAQTEALISVHDALLSTYGSQTKIVLIGHSVGAWLAAQILRARPASVKSVFFLFPTLSNMADTPRGRLLWPLFRWPMPPFLSRVAPLARYLPLSYVFPSWPAPQLSVLRSESFISSPRSVYTSLVLANEELRIIRDLDAALLCAHADKIHLFYAELDGWIADERQVVERALEGTSAAERVMSGRSDIPHAFSIDDEHGQLVAAQCLQWLKEGGLLAGT